MQTANANPHVTVTVRHETITDSLRDYSHKKIGSIHLDYPRIIEAKVILDVQKNRHIAEVVLICANHITIEASSDTEDMYKSIDETVSKIARRMRKQKTRLLKKQRTKPEDTIKHLDQKIFAESVLDHPEGSTVDPEPMDIQRETYPLRYLYKEDAIMELELSDKPFIYYKNIRRNNFQIVYRRPDGEYAVIDCPA